MPPPPTFWVGLLLPNLRVAVWLVFAVDGTFTVVLMTRRNILRAFYGSHYK